MRIGNAQNERGEPLGSGGSGGGGGYTVLIKNSNSTVSDGDWAVCINTETITINLPSGSLGQKIKISSLSSPVIISNYNGTDTFTLDMSNSWCEVVHDGSVWVLASFGAPYSSGNEGSVIVQQINGYFTSSGSCSTYYQNGNIYFDLSTEAIKSTKNSINVNAQITSGGSVGYFDVEVNWTKLKISSSLQNLLKINIDNNANTATIDLSAPLTGRYVLESNGGVISWIEVSENCQCEDSDSAV